MYLIFAGIVVALFVSGLLMKIFDDGAGPGIAGFFGVIIGICAGVAALVYSFVVWEWVASEYKAGIINREYGTQYTREEVFYGSSVIDTIRELDRRRYEVNGDLGETEE